MISLNKKILFFTAIFLVSFLHPSAISAENKSIYFVKVENDESNIQGIDLIDNNFPDELRSTDLHLWKKAENLSSDEFNKLKSDHRVLEVQKSIEYKLLAQPNDTKYLSANNLYSGQFDQWNLRKIGLNPIQDVPDGTSGWEESTGSTDTIVAVIDSGIDLGHPDLLDNVWFNSDEWGGTPGVDDDLNGYIDDVNGFNFYTANNNLTDILGHGTHVAGTIGAVSNNNAGIAGICWNCKLMILKVFESFNSTSDTTIAEAINYAVDNGANVINMSLSGVGYSGLIRDAVDYAWDNDVTVIAAAGNDTADASFYTPAGLNNLITVGATDINDAIGSFSNQGARIDVTAPGVNILSTKLRSIGAGGCLGETSYYCLSGTSMAAPHVSGLAALLYDQHKDDITPWTNIKIRAAIIKTVADKGVAGFDNTFGFGRINALSTLNLSSLDLDPSVPVVSISTPSPNYYVNNTVSLFGSVSSNDLYKYSLKFVRSGNTFYNYSGRGSKSNQQLISQDLSGLAEGTYIVTLTGEDFNGSVNDSSTVSVVIDKTIPNSFSISKSIEENTATFTFSTTDALSGISGYYISVNNGSFVSASSPYTTSFLPNGTYPVSIRAIDGIGNAREINDSFTVYSRSYMLKSVGDLSQNGRVELSDLSILATYWLTNNSTADINASGRVDISDLSILASNWQRNF